MPTTPELVKRVQAEYCPNTTRELREYRDPVTGITKQSLFHFSCGKSTCSYCGPKLRNWRVKSVLAHFDGQKMYRYEILLPEWRRLRDAISGEDSLQVPRANLVSRQIFTTVKVPGYECKYIEIEHRAMVILEAFKEIAGITELVPRASWGSLKPKRNEDDILPGYPVFEQKDHTEILEVLVETGYAKQGKRIYDAQVPPKEICMYLPEAWPHPEWRLNHPEWETTAATDEDWERLRKYRESGKRTRWTGRRKDYLELGELIDERGA